MNGQPAIPDVTVPDSGFGVDPGDTDSLTPWTRGYERKAIGQKFNLPTAPSLLDTLDDPSQLIPAALERGADLSVAEVILSEILSTMRQRTHHQGSSAISIPVEQAAAGYTRLIAPPSGNQIVRVRSFMLGPDTGPGTLQFVHGANGSAADAALTGVMPVTNGVPIWAQTANPRENPVLFTAPGAILGIVSATNKFHGWVVVDISEGGEN
jgi:hypothetical protein